MRRLAALIVAALVLPVLVVFGVAADDGTDSDGYLVRAIFDNAGQTVPGEDVRVAGAKVGTIHSMDVTKGRKAVVVLRIDDARFVPFRANARCSVRLQSLIGEKYIECEPGRDSAPKLARIDSGDGEGQHLLAVQRNSSPVDLDLINDIMRRPYRERFALVLNELGAGLAGRGRELNQVIYRANPALREFDRVLAVLAAQNRTLARLADDSDRSLAPQARARKRLSGFIRQSAKFGTATAERRGDTERGLKLLPRFLPELRSTMTQLGAFTDQARPVFSDLNRSGNDFSRMLRALGPFSRASETSVKSLGEATRVGRPALKRSRPLIQDLRGFGRATRPLAANLARLTASVDHTGGIERLMELLFFSSMSTNGFDDLGHYLRVNLVINICSRYQQKPDVSCVANFQDPIKGQEAGSSGKVASAAAIKPGERAPNGDGSVPAPRNLTERLARDGKLAPEGRKAIEQIRRQAARPGPSTPAQKEPVLDYLLGAGR